MYQVMGVDEYLLAPAGGDLQVSAAQGKAARAEAENNHF